jgi:hypothetical protein
VNFKEHLIVAEVINSVNNPEGNSAWKTRDRYERELVLLGWDLANEQKQESHPSITAIEAIMGRNHYLMQELETFYRRNIRAAEPQNELPEELEDEHIDTALPNIEAEFWQDQYEYIQRRYMDLEERYISSLPSNRLVREEERASKRRRISENNIPDPEGQGSLSANEEAAS